ncbi:uncharacterized protein TNCV_55631 [Trichonephila clavipes]|nr:uncharacterized protein TNCV_55631 [Trichonephila clavipes]
MGKKSHAKCDSDSTVCPKNSDILLAENSLIMDTEISISDEGSHAGEKEQYLNASASKLQMFPSTSISTFCTSEKSTYVLIPRDDDSKCFDANKKLVEAFLKIGKGHAALELFSMAIDIHAMDKKTFSKCLHKLYEEKCSFKEDILEISRKVVRKHHEDLLSTANGVIDITVSYYETWQKRRHSSLYGIGIVIDILTGLIINYEILSKYCPECTTAKRDLGENSAEYSIWYKSHQEKCRENYVGSSNAMEVKAAEILWKRSIKNCGMRYVSILSDGDAKTYQHLSSLNVYVVLGSNPWQSKPRSDTYTTRLPRPPEWRNKGITIGGRKEGNLKENTIVKLTNFYRKAIKDNAPDVRKMKGAILASLFHCSSTDKTPKRSNCPTGSTSWCVYQWALAKNENPMSHSLMKTKLSEQDLEKILPVYQRLANDELLERCSAQKCQQKHP